MEKTSNEAIAEIKKLMQPIPVSTPRSIKIIVFIMSLFLFVDTKIQQFFQTSKKNFEFLSISFSPHPSPQENPICSIFG